MSHEDGQNDDEYERKHLERCAISWAIEEFREAAKRIGMRGTPSDGDIRATLFQCRGLRIDCIQQYIRYRELGDWRFFPEGPGAEENTETHSAQQGLSTLDKA
jgi:hypothetical protein